MYIPQIWYATIYKNIFLWRLLTHRQSQAEGGRTNERSKTPGDDAWASEGIVPVVYNRAMGTI